jgi:hypothetical protein
MQDASPQKKISCWIFLSTTASRTALGPIQPPIQRVPGTLSLGVKWPGREADHSPPSSTEVKECVELYLHFPWRCAQFKKKGTGTFLPLRLLNPRVSHLYSKWIQLQQHWNGVWNDRLAALDTWVKSKIPRFILDVGYTYAIDLTLSMFSFFKNANYEALYYFRCLVLKQPQPVVLPLVWKTKFHSIPCA